MEKTHNQQSSESPKGVYIPEDCNFDNIKETYVPNECTPKIKDRKFEGIVINAPKEVFFVKGETKTAFGGFANIPICGICIHNLGTPISAPVIIRLN